MPRLNKTKMLNMNNPNIDLETIDNWLFRRYGKSNIEDDLENAEEMVAEYGTDPSNNILIKFLDNYTKQNKVKVDTIAAVNNALYSGIIDKIDIDDLDNIIYNKYLYRNTLQDVEYIIKVNNYLDNINNLSNLLENIPEGIENDVNFPLSKKDINLLAIYQGEDNIKQIKDLISRNKDALKRYFLYKDYNKGQLRPAAELEKYLERFSKGQPKSSKISIDLTDQEKASYQDMLKKADIDSPKEFQKLIAYLKQKI